MATSKWTVCWVFVCSVVSTGGLHLFAQTPVAIKFEDGTGLQADQAVLMEVANPGYIPVRWRARDQPVLYGPGPTDKPLFLRDIRRLEYYTSDRVGVCAVVVTLRDEASLVLIGGDSFDEPDDAVLGRLPAEARTALRLRTWSKEYRGYNVQPVRLLLELRLKRDSIRIWDPFACAFINPANAHGERRGISKISFE